MEPLSIWPLFGSEDKEEKETTETTETTETHTIGGNIKVEEINTNLIRSIVDLKKQIFEFKKTLFFELVTNDIYHSPSNINAMMAFHALWLQMIAFWIGTLDTRSIPEPNFPSKKLTENFKLLSVSIKYGLLILVLILIRIYKKRTKASS